MQVKAIALDIDGTLTDGSFYWTESGEEIKKFCFRDVMGISIALTHGIVFALISGESGPIVERYAEKLRIDHVYAGCRDKRVALSVFSQAIGIDLSEVLYMGDDVNDLGALELAGFAAAPSNAVSAVKRVARFVTAASGGAGAVREVIDHVLETDAIRSAQANYGVPKAGEIACV